MSAILLAYYTAPVVLLIESDFIVCMVKGATVSEVRWGYN